MSARGIPHFVRVVEGPGEAPQFFDKPSKRAAIISADKLAGAGAVSVAIFAGKSSDNADGEPVMEWK